MALATEDRLAITELVSLHGHLFDDGRLDELTELFTEDVVYDVSAFGQGELVGIAIREAALVRRAANPTAITSPTSSSPTTSETAARGCGPKDWGSWRTAGADRCRTRTSWCDVTGRGASRGGGWRHVGCH